MITAEQMRAARALLRMEQATLAELSGVSLPTIKRLETTTGELRAQESTLNSIVSALSRSGIIFIDEDAPSSGGGAGIRLIENPNQAWNRKVADVFEQIRRQKADWRIADVLSDLGLPADDNVSVDDLDAIITGVLERAENALTRTARDPQMPDLFNLMTPPEAG